jgi:hypothetical protein
MYFNLLPTKNTYDSLLEKNSVSFVDLEQVIIKRLSSAETDFVRDSCPGCTFYRAWISLRNQPGETAKLVYLDLKYITWKNTETGEFSEPRSAELKYLDAIYFRDDIRK